MQIFSAFFFEMFNKSADRLRFLQIVIIIMMKHLDESPLCPVVIIGIAGSDFSVPIITESDFVELITVTSNIIFCRYRRMLTCLNGVLFCRKSESIKTHRMEYVKAFQPFVTAVDVGCNVTQRMSDMQPCSRRIREHIQNIIFRFVWIFNSFINLMVFPVSLPFSFYFSEIVLHKSLKFNKFNLISLLLQHSQIKFTKLINLPKQKKVYSIFGSNSTSTN